MAIPMKSTVDVDMVQPLKNLILSAYDKLDSQEFTPKLEELNRLRKQSVCKALDRSETSMECLSRYFDQLRSLEMKLPESGAVVPFKWKDAFDKGGLFSGRQSLTNSSLGFERVCVLWNIGALASQLATEQDLSNDAGLKGAARQFQLAAGVYDYLKDNVMSTIQQEPTPDMHPETLNALSALMLAQAQEVFFTKAEKDGFKPALRAKIAAQANEWFGDALRGMQKDIVKSNEWEKDWVARVACKQAAFHALSQFYEGLVAKENREYGEQLARMKYAHDLMIEAKKRSALAYTSRSFPFEHEEKLIEREYHSIKKDNEFIYHARIPDVKSLNPISKACLAKPTPLPQLFTPQEKYTDMFDALMPLPIHSAINQHNARLNDAKNHEITMLRTYTQEMNAALASMNLPACVEETQSGEVPVSIKSKNEAVRGAGGYAPVEEQIKALPGNMQRNRELLNEAERLLNDEIKSDRELREKFKDKWNRTSSDKLTAPLKQEIDKYHMIITNGERGDKTIQEKFEKHRAGIILLSKSEYELAQAIPAASQTRSAQNSPAVSRLRELMSQIEGVKAERDVTEHQIKEAVSDVKERFLHASKSEDAKTGAASPAALEAMSVEAIGRVMAPLAKQARENCERQNSLMNDVRKAFDEMQKSQGGSDTQSRDKVLTELTSAYDAFTELKSNLSEGAKFHADLTQLLLRIQNKIKDFVFARDTEKTDLLQALQANIVNRDITTSGTPQQFQSTSGDAPVPTDTTQRTPPARPPPPASSTPATLAHQHAPVSQFNNMTVQQQQPPAYGSAAPPANYGAGPGYPQQPSYPQYPYYGTYPGAAPPQYNPYGANPYAYPMQGYPPYYQQGQQQQQQQPPNQNSQGGGGWGG